MRISQDDNIRVLLNTYSINSQYDENMHNQNIPLRVALPSDCFLIEFNISRYKMA